MMSIKNFVVLAAAIFVLTFASRALAQETPFSIENMPNVIGVGGGIIPDYEGSNNYTVGAAPYSWTW